MGLMMSVPQVFIVTVYVWDCPYCGTSLQLDTPGELNVAGREHLLEEHEPELVDEYGRGLASDNCHGGCGYQFSELPSTPADYVCPECRYDNLRYFAGKGVWSRIKKG